MSRGAPFRFGWTLLVAALAGLAPLRAQERPLRPFLQDYHAFRFILHSQGLGPVNDLNQLHDDPQKTLLIAFGDTRLLDTVGLPNYLSNGGALLLATDQATPEVIGDQFGVRVTGAQVRTKDPAAAYRGLEECPLVKIVERSLPPFAHVDPSDPAKCLATNRPSTFRHAAAPRGGMAPFPGEPMAWYSDMKDDEWNAFAMVAWRRSRDHPPEQQPIVLLPDHSLFINAMMLQADNGNFLFAEAAVRWLSNGGARKRVLFLDDGAVVDKFQVPLSEIPDPTQLPPEHLPLPTVDVFNQILASWQDEDVFNRLILERFSMQQILSALTLSLTAALVAYGSYRLWRARYLQDIHP